MNRPIIIAISLYLALLIGVLFIFPKYKILNFINDRIEVQNNQKKENEDYFKKIEGFSDRIHTDYSEAISKIDSALPHESSPADLFNFFQGETNNILKINSVSLGNISKLTGDFSKITGLSFNITMEGTYPTFKKFLSEIEKSARLITVENISFSSKPEKEDISFKMMVKTYIFPE